MRTLETDSKNKGTLVPIAPRHVPSSPFPPHSRLHDWLPRSWAAPKITCKRRTRAASHQNCRLDSFSFHDSLPLLSRHLLAMATAFRVCRPGLVRSHCYVSRRWRRANFEYPALYGPWMMAPPRHDPLSRALSRLNPNQVDIVDYIIVIHRVRQQEFVQDPPSCHIVTLHKDPGHRTHGP